MSQLVQLGDCLGEGEDRAEVVDGDSVVEETHLSQLLHDQSGLDLLDQLSISINCYCFGFLWSQRLIALKLPDDFHVI